MHRDQLPDRRGRTDRRLRPTRPWDAFRGHSRRARHRREELELGSRFRFVDRYRPSTGVLAALLLVCCVADGVFTLLLLDLECEEANPVMALLIDRSSLAFILVKYAMTTVGLVVLLVYDRYPLFGTRFRVGYLIPAFVGLYVVLLLYQLTLFHLGSADAPRPTMAAVAQGTSS